MHDEPRQKLRELIIEYGRSLCDDPRRCEALLKDYCGQYKRAIVALLEREKQRGIPAERIVLAGFSQGGRWRCTPACATRTGWPGLWPCPATCRWPAI